MGWITFTAVSIMALLLLAILAMRGSQAKRADRLEAAFFRARGNRMISNGFVPGR